MVTIQTVITDIDECNSCGLRHTNVKVSHAVEPGVACFECPVEHKTTEA